jgi:hypothetical protein
MKYYLTIFLTMISPCLLGEFYFPSQINIINKYSSKPDYFVSPGTYFYTLEYIEDNMSLCYLTVLNERLTTWLTKFYLNELMLTKDNYTCLPMDPHLCNDEVTICYIITLFANVLEIHFDRTGQRIAFKPDQVLVNYLSDRRTNFINQYSKTLEHKFRPYYFGDMRLATVKGLYHSLLLSLEGKVNDENRRKFEDAASEVDIHLFQNAYFYKDNMGNILDIFKQECSSVSVTKKQIKNYKRTKDFIDQLDLKKFENKLLYSQAWNNYRKFFIKTITPSLHSNFLKPIFTSLLSLRNGEGAFDELYQKPCIKPKNIQSLRNVDQESL